MEPIFLTKLALLSLKKDHPLQKLVQLFRIKINLVYPGSIDSRSVNEEGDPPLIRLVAKKKCPGPSSETPVLILTGGDCW